MQGRLRSVTGTLLYSESDEQVTIGYHRVLGRKGGSAARLLRLLRPALLSLAVLLAWHEPGPEHSTWTLPRLCVPPWLTGMTWSTWRGRVVLPHCSQRLPERRSAACRTLRQPA